jgi:hypothetical protein
MWCTATTVAAVRPIKSLALAEPCLVVFALLHFRLRFGLSPNVVVIVIKQCASIVITYLFCFPKGVDFLSAHKKENFYSIAQTNFGDFSLHTTA